MQWPIWMERYCRLEYFIVPSEIFSGCVLVLLFVIQFFVMLMTTYTEINDDIDLVRMILVFRKRFLDVFAIIEETISVNLNTTSWSRGIILRSSELSIRSSEHLLFYLHYSADLLFILIRANRLIPQPLKFSGILKYPSFTSMRYIWYLVGILVSLVIESISLTRVEV